MPLDYTWSHDPIFPADVFADPKAGPLLERVGIAFDMRGNQVPSFHSIHTVVALAKAPRLILDDMVDMGLALAPHSAKRPGDDIAERARFAVEKLHDIADRNAAGDLSDEDAKSSVFHLHLFLSEHAVRRIVKNTETGKFDPDPKLNAVLADQSSEPFEATKCTEALDAGPSSLPDTGKKTTSSPLPDGIALTAIVLLDDAGDCASVKTRITSRPDILEGFEIDDLSHGSFMAQRDSTMFVAMAMESPYPAEDLRAFCSGNALAMDIWETAAKTKGHVHLQYMRRTDGPATREDAMILARAAAAIGGSVVIWGAAKAATPGETFASAVHSAEKDDTWPTMAMLRMQIYKQDARSGVALVGLRPFTGHDMALACDDDANISEVAGRALGLAGWILDTRPRFADGDTMGVEGSGGAQLRVHQIKGADGFPLFEFRPYDGPAAQHTPEDRAAEVARAEAEVFAAPAKSRPFWKFWAK